ncbi:biopolymer transporter ExbD, partial [bacterium]|nr:biopolymer transporter ExbD [bacterium]
MIIGSSKPDDAPQVELTPIVDMVFLLLIFFLVATTYQQAERETRITLPEAEAAGPITLALREIVINVDGDGSIIVAGQAMTIEELRSLVTEAVGANPEQKVSIRGDREAAYGTVARVLDVCKAAGIDEPFL